MHIFPTSFVLSRGAPGTFISSMRRLRGLLAIYIQHNLYLIIDLPWSFSDWNIESEKQIDSSPLFQLQPVVNPNFSSFLFLLFIASAYNTSSKSFIFSLRNKEGLAPFKSMVTNTSFSVYRGSSCGPTFGEGHDIYIADNANQNANSYTNFGTSYSLPNEVTDRYTILAGTRYFSPDEVEVFYLAWVLLTPWFPCAELVWNQWKIHPKNLFKTYCKAESIETAQNFEWL